MIKIIPAIDIIEGKCVRLTQGNFENKKIYFENPVEVAKMFENNGIKKLHLVDLDGAKNQHIVNSKVLLEISRQTNLEIDFGGGIKSEKDIEIAFENGANQITLGSIAVREKEKTYEWLRKYGNEKLILGADVKNCKIAINGWKETTEIDIFSFLKEFSKSGFQNVICTDISKDGLMSGSSVELYKKILEKFPKINLIASGGVSSVSEIYKLQEIGVYGVIIGKAIYEGLIKLTDLKSFIL